MAKENGSSLQRVVWSIGRGLNRVRIVVLNLIFFFLVFLVLSAMFSDRVIPVPEGAALVLAPHGRLVEEYTVDPLSRAINEAVGSQTPETRMRDLLLAIDRAAEDERIEALVISPVRMAHAGMAQLNELAAAIAEFKQSGKPVYAYGGSYTQKQYYLAAQADKVYLHPQGMILLPGFSQYRMYFASALDKLGVQVHLFRVGKFKSAAEPFIRNDMSPAARKANLAWLSDLWNNYVTEIARARGMQPTLVRDYVNRFAARLESAGGDAARAALEANLVDALMSRNEFRSKMIELVGENDSHSFEQISATRYAKAQRQRNMPDGGEVAVIVAQGAIVMGQDAPNTIGAEAMVEKIRQVRFDEDVDALVYRINSPGGSAFASELIRQELARLRQSGMPVVVSMSTVAASGGYWIATPANRIFASPSTITGSIGVFGLLMRIPQTLDKVGINVDGVGTTSLAGAFQVGEPLPPKLARIIQGMVEQTYQQFITLVAESRGLAPERVREIAQGRVWSGEAAAKRGLVDELGGLEEAIVAAAELAGLEQWHVDYVGQGLSPFERWVVDISAGAMVWAGLDGGSLLPDWLSRVRRQARLFAGRASDPRHVYAYCFCTPR